MCPALERLAGAGYTAVPLDAWQHGERGDDPDTPLDQGRPTRLGRWFYQQLAR